MALIKYKKPVEYSFIVWMNGVPESNHPIDFEKFYSFVKNVCQYNASRWKDKIFLKNKILERKPKFNPKKLESTLYLYEHLIKFYKTNALPGSWIIEANTQVQRGCYVERGVKNGELYKKEIIKPLP